MIDNGEYLEIMYEEPSCLVEVCTLGIIDNSISHDPENVTERNSLHPNESLSTNNMCCEECELSFLDITEFNKHISQKKCRRKYSCVYCTSTFRRMDHLKRHVMSLHHKSKYFTCPTCDKDCRSNYMLLKHIKNHKVDESQVIKCRGCEYKCKSLEELVEHESTHLLMDGHICTHCKKPFKRRDHMLRHVKSLHLNQQTVCPICSQSFKRKDHVVRHLREKHKMLISKKKLINIPEEMSEKN